MSKIVKKFINKPEDCVSEALKGLVLADENLKFCKHNIRVIYRSDIEDLIEKKKVTLFSGGGSGHEPFAAGFVGKFGLSAAVCGDIFASPSSESVYSGLECIKSGGGTIVFVINYTGDRLNFGMAVEKFRVNKKDSKIDLIFIDDDIALKENNGITTGNRGLAGAILVFQIIGYLSEENGKEFEEMLKESNEIINNIATFGISIEACAIPGKSKMFELKNNEMELGLGIHGEPGCERIKQKSAKDSIGIVMEKLTKSHRLNLGVNDKFIILLNNLGSISQIEMNVLRFEILHWLAKNEFTKLEKFLVGTVMTSIDAKGFSVTILKVKNDSWIKAFDIPSAISRHLNITKPDVEKFCSKLSIEKQNDEKSVEKVGVKIGEKSAEKFKNALIAALKALKEKEEELNKLDGCGDGDCGTTLKTAAECIQDAAENKKIAFEYPMAAFIQISQIFEKSVGGTTGAIYAIFFTAASTLFQNTFDTDIVHQSLKRGLEAIIKYGHAKPGHRTLVDPLNAAVEAVKEPKNEQDWKKIVKAAQKSADETAKMKAKSGRASYTSAEQQTLSDPGAVAVAIWMTAVFNSFYKK
uniref:Triokinase/FMN cyclase n=1 Tax=Panagrolaimus sp. PS1159 TaxID=55785 RepID=A0AC35F598_9BILA